VRIAAIEDRGAQFSECRTYRYTLWRIWDEDGPHLNVIGLNPSTADETSDDPTSRRCIGFARAWGYGGLVMTNLFAFRSTDPAGLTTVADPIGPMNDHHLEISACSGTPLAAWGAHPIARARGAEIMRRLHDLDVQCLGLTKSGAPRHPLYVPRTTQPISFEVKP
jgi:hypothetical protein